MPTKRGDRHTAVEILETAERLVQTRGFNGFSYADIAAELGITKPALHYHFAGKAELGEALVEGYTARFAAALLEIDRQAIDATAKLAAYTDIYATVLQQGRMCLCGMLAAEFGTLPDAMRQGVLRFFRENDAWLAGVFEQGRTEGCLRLGGSPLDAARTLTGALEGAMLVARLHDEPARFRAAADLLLAGLARAPEVT